MPARASAANQAPLRDRPAIAEWSRSAAIVPHPGSRPGLSLRCAGRARHPAPAHRLVTSNAMPSAYSRMLLSDKYLVPTELTGMRIALAEPLVPGAERLASLDSDGARRTASLGGGHRVQPAGRAGPRPRRSRAGGPGRA